MSTNLRFPFYLTFCLVASLTFNPRAKGKEEEKNRCKKMTMEEWTLSDAFKKKLPLIFFASWCSSCEEKLEKYSKRTENPVYFIGIFDEATQIEIVAKKYNLSHCIIDANDSIAGFYKIKSLPAKNINL